MGVATDIKYVRGFVEIPAQIIPVQSVNLKRFSKLETLQPL